MQDGLYHADVAVENVQSRGVCRSLKGSIEWSVYCMSVLDLRAVLAWMH